MAQDAIILRPINLTCLLLKNQYSSMVDLLKSSLSLNCYLQKALNFVSDPFYLLWLQLWKHWQGNELIGASLSYRETTCSIAQKFVGILQMYRYRIVNPTKDFLFHQSAYER